jgi:drug/metabolite transporter (DMT)-like permease
VSSAREWAALPVACSLALLWLIPQMWLYAWGAARLDPGRVSILMLVEPMVAVISAGLLLSEPLSGRELLGCVLILSAAVLDLATPLQRPFGKAIQSM